MRSTACVKHLAGKKIATTGSRRGGRRVRDAGQGVLAAVHPYVAAVKVPNATPILQLATSFKITGPLAVADHVARRLDGDELAPAAFHAFKQGAWMTQTGRGAAVFTWCWGNPACAKITQGTKPIIVKYTGGAATRSAARWPT